MIQGAVIAEYGSVKRTVRGPEHHDLHELLFALLVACAFLALAGWGAYHHEMWRDEAHVYLLTRDSSSPFAILHNARYDGHPTLWYLLVWPFARGAHSLIAMQVVHVAIGVATAFLVARFAPAPRWVRALATLGYFPLYEYGVIARNYGLGLLLLIAFCVAFSRRRAHPIMMGLVLALAANTSLPATILAIAGIAALCADAFRRGARNAGWATWTGISVAGAGVLVAAMQMKPPPDSGYMSEWRMGFDASNLAEVLRTITAAFVPLPRFGANSWGASLVDALPGFRWWSVILAVVLLALAVVALLRSPVALVFYLSATAGLLAFFYLKSVGYIRHQGFLFVALAVALWIAAATREVEGSAQGSGVARWSERALRIVFPVLLAVHVIGATIALATEHQFIFSGAQETAKLIRKYGLERLPMVVHQDWMGMAVLAYLDKDRAYYAAGSRWGSYIIWDTARYTERNVWAEALRFSLRTGESVLVLMDVGSIRREPPPEQLQAAIQKVGCRPGEIVSGESFCVSVLERGRIPPFLEQLGR